MQCGRKYNISLCNGVNCGYKAAQKENCDTSTSKLHFSTWVNDLSLKLNDKEYYNTVSSQNVNIASSSIYMPLITLDTKNLASLKRVTWHELLSSQVHPEMSTKTTICDIRQQELWQKLKRLNGQTQTKTFKAAPSEWK